MRPRAVVEVAQALGERCDTHHIRHRRGSYELSVCIASPQKQLPRLIDGRRVEGAGRHAADASLPRLLLLRLLRRRLKLQTRPAFSVVVEGESVRPYGGTTGAAARHAALPSPVGAPAVHAPAIYSPTHSGRDTEMKALEYETTVQQQRVLVAACDRHRVHPRQAPHQRRRHPLLLIVMTSTAFPQDDDDEDDEHVAYRVFCSLPPPS